MPINEYNILKATRESHFMEFCTETVGFWTVTTMQMMIAAWLVWQIMQETVLMYRQLKMQ